MNGEYFFHSEHKMRGKRRRPRITLAAVVDNNNNLVVGASKCSVLDNFSRKIGRQRSMERAKNKPLYVISLEKKPEDKSMGVWFKSIATSISGLIYRGVIRPSVPLTEQNYVFTPAN